MQNEIKVEFGKITENKGAIQITKGELKLLGAYQFDDDAVKFMWMVSPDDDVEKLSELIMECEKKHLLVDSELKQALA